MYIVILRVRLDRACRGVSEAVVVGAKAAHIQPPHVPLRVTFDDPFCHDLTDAACARQSMSAEGTCYPEALDRRGTEQVFAVGREAFGAIEKLLDLDALHDRHALNGVLHQ